MFRSNKHLSVQVIDDTKMHTLASISTMQKTVAEEFNYSAGPTLVISLYRCYYAVFSFFFVLDAVILFYCCLIGLCVVNDNIEHILPVFSNDRET